MNIELYFMAIFFILNASGFIYITNIFEKKYETKTSKIKASLMGKIESLFVDLINDTDFQKTAEKNQTEEYNTFIKFFRDSKLLSYIGLYEHIIDYEKEGEKFFNKLATYICAYIFPVILFIYDDLSETTNELSYISLLAVVFITFLLFTKLIDLYEMDRDINKDYNLYVKDQESFGGYDL